MPIYVKNNKLISNRCKIKSINPAIISNHINSSTLAKLVGKNASTDRAIYSTQDPINNNFVRSTSCWLNGVTNISCFSPAQLENGSGSGWNVKAGTLITPRHILLAKHYLINILSGGTPIVFVDENNNIIKRNLIQYANHATTDIAIGLLDNDVPDNIKIAKVLPSNYEYYMDLQNNGGPANYQIYSVGLDYEEKALLLNFIYIDSTSGAAIFYPLNAIDPYYSFTESIIVGDSGNPVFFIIDNTLVLLITWYTSVGGPSVSYYYNVVNGLINSLSPNQGYGLSPIDLGAVYHKYK